MSALAHTIRRATAEDRGFVVKPWLQELRRSSTTRYVSDSVFFQQHGRLVQKLLARASVDLACDPADDQHFYGFVAHEPGVAEHAEPVIHWLYVKMAFRQLGLGRSLLAHVTHGGRAIASHATDMLMGPMRAVIEKYGITYDPYVLRGIDA